MSGTLIGPALGKLVLLCNNCSLLTHIGPFIGGIIVTFRTWRDIFWLQTALAGVAALLCFFLQPETIHEKRSRELQGLPAAKKAHKMWQWLNPFRVIRLYRYPNLFLVVSVFVSSMRTRGQFADEAPTRLCRLLHWSGTCTPCLLLSAMFSTRGSTSNHLSSPVYSILLQAVDTSSEPSSVAGMPITSSRSTSESAVNALLRIVFEAASCSWAVPCQLA